MTHREISERVNQNFDDLEQRDPEKYRELEEKYRRLEHETSFAVSQSPPGGAKRAGPEKTASIWDTVLDMLGV